MLKTTRYEPCLNREPNRTQGRQIIISTSFILLSILLIGAIFSGCDLFEKQELTLKPDTLTVLTRNIPTAYYLGPEGETGFEYDLVKIFAEDLGLKLKIKVANSLSEMLAAMATNQADIAAGGLIHTREREQCFTFGPDYDTVRQQLVYRKGNQYPRSIEELQNFPLIVPARSSYAERL
ncbi:MAG: transporter substrate-binding domain-containing protein, partial [Deltaproteobacteria bacterium]|nr:transporter substrate-binding domain-containing protein [Deltaproteobacteria bacterium]